MDSFDLIIIGGGPTGLFAAFYAGLRKIRVAIVDSLDSLGGQLTALYPEKYIFDVPGFPQILARELADRLIEQAKRYEPTILLGQTVRQLERAPADTHFALHTSDQMLQTRTILIAAGAGAFTPKKLLVPGAAELEGESIFYSVPTRERFRGQRVLVVGGGDSAVDTALHLQEVAAHVTLIHRRNQFRAHEATVQQMIANGVQVLTFREIAALEQVDGKLEAAVVINNQNREQRTLPVDAIVAQLGFSTSLGPLHDWPILIKGGSIPVDSHMQTSVPGIFCAGDVAAYDGKLKLIATGFGEAAVAVNFAKTLLDPTAKAFPGHSSELSPQQNIVTV
jgi:thioredoxin reductase